VIIIGGGLAGLAAATALAPRGFQVTILESRNRLGGRASSFTDPASGQQIDNCQHVSMGCCTEFTHFCHTIGIDRYLAVQPCLYFMTPDGKVSKFTADSLPAPLHLTRSFMRMHFLTAVEKLRVLWGLAWLRAFPPRDDPSFLYWLRAHGQTQATIDRFWSVVLTSALNETIDRIGLRPARKVFVDGFVRGRHSWEVMVPTIPLGRLYGEEMLHWFEKHSIGVVLNAAVRQFNVSQDLVTSLSLRSGEEMTADHYISAVPFARLLDLLPPNVIEAHENFANLRRLETSSITSVHFWFDRSVLNLPHVVLLDSLGQWIFNRGQTDTGEYYVQIVVSASRAISGAGHEDTERRIHEELRRIFPAATEAKLLRARVVTEHSATFSAVPGVDSCRPSQHTPIRNLFLAGDWTNTGWPATMEGAVRSGNLAAEAVTHDAAS
jgi:squalene-associated FAD-dependent desaturase